VIGAQIIPIRIQDPPVLPLIKGGERGFSHHLESELVQGVEYSPVREIMADQQVRYDVDKTGAFVRTLTVAPKGDGPLNGLRFAVKDLMDLAGYKTSCGNPSWRDSHPVAAAHAVCVDQILNAGGTCIGKTVTDELAFGLDGENYFYGTPLNPRAPDRAPGGSSSGSASAVACGLADFALGTDTGGSVRVPAANCGIYGFRPTHGAVSVAGVNPLAPTFDTVGALAATADVLSQAMAVLLGCDIPDSVAVGSIYLLRDAFASSDPEVARALAKPIASLNVLEPENVIEASLEAIAGSPLDGELGDWYDVYRTIQWAEIWSCLGSWVLHEKPHLGPRTTRNFELARNLDRSTVPGAIRRREHYFMLLKNFLGPRDLVCMPTTPAPAPVKGTLTLDRTTGRYYPRALSLTSIAGIGRLPQVTVPVSEVGGAPVGLSLLAAQGNDGFLLAVAKAMACANAFFKR
jgi:amidase